MTVSLQDVERVAELANLELTDVEKTTMLRDLNSVLDYFGELNQLDTAAVAPMTQPENAGLTLRADTIAPSLNRENVLKEAPDTDGVFFKVPKVIER